MRHVLTEQIVRAVIGGAVDRVSTSDLESAEDFYDFGLDSLDHAMILLRLEETYGLHVAEEDFELCSSIEAIVAYAARQADP